MRLDTFLTESGTTVTDFARRCCVARWTVHRWISGAVVPSREHMAQIGRLTEGEVGPADFYDAPHPSPAPDLPPQVAGPSQSSDPGGEGLPGGRPAGQGAELCRGTAGQISEGVGS